MLVVVHHWRDVTWQRQDALGRPRTPYGWVADRRSSSLGYRWYIARVWYARAMAVPVVPWPGWWYTDAICIHGKEGSWTADTGNGYYGGMQFDVGTWLSNGGGQFAATANLASPSEQLLVSWWLYQSRGWAPWPNTAAACGLL